jgi:hypothetical protein
VDVPPVIGGGVCRIDAECFGSVDGLEHFSTFRQQALATGIQVLNRRAGLPGRDRGRISIFGRVVPYSFDAQRIRAKTS